MTETKNTTRSDSNPSLVEFVKAVLKALLLIWQAWRLFKKDEEDNDK